MRPSRASATRGALPQRAAARVSLRALGAALLASLCAANALAQVPETLTPRQEPVADLEPPRAGPRLMPQQSIPRPELEAFVDATVRLTMDDKHIAGVTVSVVQDGRVVLEKGYGFASFAPPRRVDPATTLFRIGSISKTFTWIEVMRAVEAGKIDLDAPVNAYLPAELEIPDEGFKQPIRVRDLMTHSPGFEDRVFGVLFARNPADLLPLEEFLRRYRPRRVREPGELSSYSNYGAALAGEIVARVQGAPWQDLVERDILKPLGLTHVTGREPYPPRPDLPAPLAAELEADLSTPFRWNGTAYDARDFEYITQIAPAGVMSATAHDMARYMLLLLGDGKLDGVTVFGPDAARAFRTPLTKLPPEVGALDAGFFQSPLPGGFLGYGHNGATLSFFSNMTVVPALRLGIFVSTNTEGGGALSDPLAARVIERFYAPPRDAPAPRAELAVADAQRKYAGEYLSTRRRYGGLEGFVMRLSQATVSVTPDGYLLVGLGAVPQRFVPTDRPDEFRNAERASGPLGTLHFERDGERATRVALIPIAFERVTPLYSRNTLFVLAGLVLLASAGAALGGFSRLVHKPAASAGQRLAGRVQLAAAWLWLASFAAFAVFGARAADTTNIIYSWPGVPILAASSAALAASVLTLLGALFLPAVWRGALDGARPVAGWSTWRKLRYTLAFLSFASFAIVLGAWGALAPWQP
ncbi:MAG TPA: serine hydrolase domain-containing protein [Gammaproteobacteria bacterium]|nr:serine hydrolase domain-containing protein [Gammaproteobacteria bacterium]